MASLSDKFSKNVAALRALHKLSQREFADKVGISVSYVGMLENKQRSPPLRTIEIIANVFKVPPTSLLD